MQSRWHASVPGPRPVFYAFLLTCHSASGPVDWHQFAHSGPAEQWLSYSDAEFVGDGFDRGPIQFNPYSSQATSD
jgi:hypothetical protein